MYKIFVDNKLIILTNIQDYTQTSKYFLLDEISVENVLKKMEKNNLKKVVLFHPKKEKLLEKFTKKIKLVRAAGGIVTNAKGETLFIKRKGKWDLPKGKLEKNEDLRTCAVREVMEETGIENISIESLKNITYHIFKRDGIFQLKETYWYNMTSNFEGKFVPQMEEDIEKVKWKSPEKLQKTLEKSYANIQELFKNETE